MKKRRFIPLSITLGGCHCLASMLIVPFTLKMGSTLSAGALKTQLLGILHFITAILYFPIISLALYPRTLFPGNWIYVPIIANSILWGFVLAALVIGVSRVRSG